MFPDSENCPQATTVWGELPEARENPGRVEAIEESASLVENIINADLKIFPVNHPEEILA